MPSLVINNPNDRQAEFFLADKKIIAFGGA